MQYRVTRKFINGTLSGLTHTGLTSVYMPVGLVCKKPFGRTSGYEIIACEEV